MLRMAGEGEPRFSTCQGGGARSRRRIYYFHFVLRQPLIVLHYYCLQLGANLFRLDSAVVSLMPFSLFCCKKREGFYRPTAWQKNKKKKKTNVAKRAVFKHQQRMNPNEDKSKDEY